MLITLEQSNKDQIQKLLAESEDVLVVTDRDLDCIGLRIVDDWSIPLLKSLLTKVEMPPVFPLAVAIRNTDTRDLLTSFMSDSNVLFMVEDSADFKYSDVAERVRASVPAYKKVQDLQLASDIYPVLKSLEKGNSVLKTGFENLDKALGGGFNDGCLYVMGAIPSLGKSTLCLNIADNIASRGTDVLMFSLEMTRTELIIKSLVRKSVKVAAGDGHKVACFAELVNQKSGCALPESKAQCLSEAANLFASTSGKKLAVVAGCGKTTAADVRSVVDLYRKLDRKPLVIVDYMQILKPITAGSERQIMDRNLAELKSMSMDFQVPVLGISSLNRMSYEEDISFLSFKETGGIETWSDVVLGMQLYVPERRTKEWSKLSPADRRRLLADAKSRSPRLIEVVVLKNRRGQIENRIYFDYFPKYDSFGSSDTPLEEEL